MISSIKYQGGFIVSSGIAAISLSPVLFILASGMNADPDIWSHLKQYVLPGLLKNTAILVVIVLVIFAAESWLRRKQQFFNRGGHQPVQRKRLNGFGHFLASAFCSTVLLVSFVIPVIQLLYWTAKAFAFEFGTHYIRLVANTFFLGLMGTAVTLAVALILAYSGRRMTDLKTGMAAKLSLSGYALPGTVLAVGMVHGVTWLDNGVTGTMDMLGIQLPGTLLQGSLVLLPVCYMIRFLAVGYNPVFSHMTRLTPSIDEAARLMKVTGAALVSKIHLPLIHRGMVTGGILVLVEIFKEMPVTLMLRPFGWDTLAVKIFELTSEGEWERAALPAVTLVLVGMIPVGFLTFIGRSKKQHVPEG